LRKITLSYYRKRGWRYTTQRQGDVTRCDVRATLQDVTLG